MLQIHYFSLLLIFCNIFWKLNSNLSNALNGNSITFIKHSMQIYLFYWFSFPLHNLKTRMIENFCNQSWTKQARNMVSSLCNYFSVKLKKWKLKKIQKFSLFWIRFVKHFWHTLEKNIVIDISYITYLLFTGLSRSLFNLVTFPVSCIR